MIGLRRIAHDESAEVLRLARGMNLGQAPKDDYDRVVSVTERELGIR